MRGTEEGSRCAGLWVCRALSGGLAISPRRGRVEEPGTLQCSTVLRKEAAYQAESHKHS